MRTLYGFFLSLCLLSAAAPAHAQGALPPAQTVGWLSHACADWQSLPNLTSREIAWCVAVMTGYKAGMAWSWTLATGRRLDYWCAPRGVDIPESIGVFVQWASQNTARWDDPWFIGISDSFKAAWPCPESEKK